MKTYYGYSIESASEEREQRLLILKLKNAHFTYKEIVDYFLVEKNVVLKVQYVRDCTNHFPYEELINKHYDKLISKINSINAPTNEPLINDFKINKKIVYKFYLKNINIFKENLIPVLYLENKTDIENKGLLIKDLSLNYKNGYILLNKYNERVFIPKKRVKLFKGY